VGGHRCRYLARLTFAAAAMALLAGCGETRAGPGPAPGGEPGDGAMPAGPPAATASPPNLDTALAHWGSFPATVTPRPIVALDELPVPQDGFATDPAKLAFACRQIDAAIVRYPATPDRATLRWPDGTATEHRPLAAKDAVAAIDDAGPPTNVDCAGVAPVRITGIKLGETTLRTDRGLVTATGWTFTGPDVRGDGLSYPAIHEDRYWGFAPELRAGQLVATEVAADGRRLTAYFYGTPTNAGACTSEYEAIVAESPAAVAIALRTLPPAQPPPTDVACAEIAQLRTLTVSLAGPLGGRVVVDEQGGVTPVCPAGRIDSQATGTPAC